MPPGPAEPGTTKNAAQLSLVGVTVKVALPDPAVTITGTLNSSVVPGTSVAERVGSTTMVQPLAVVTNVSFVKSNELGSIA